MINSNNYFVSSNIFEEIQQQLKHIETEKNVRVLYACESGSRAWGFPSPDSDYDVRFIYVHERDWYLSLHEQKDVIEKNLEGDLDISGWDMRKTLRLIAKSNAVIWEWLQSPIIYANKNQFDQSLLTTANSFYSLKAGAYHYLSSCKRVHDETYENKEFISTKKYFYILRPLLAALWICDKQTIPPMTLQALCETDRLNHGHQTEISKLLALKVDANEKSEIPRSQLIDQFIETTLEICANQIEQLPVAKGQSAQLDTFFQHLFQ